MEAFLYNCGWRTDSSCKTFEEMMRGEEERRPTELEEYAAPSPAPLPTKSELRVHELAEEMATLNEDATQLDAELLEVQREMLETMRSQLEVEREKNKVLSQKLASRPTRCRDSSMTSVLKAVYREYCEEEGRLSRRRWAKLCEDLGLAGRTDVDLALYETTRSSSSSRREHRRASLDFRQFLEALETLLSRRDDPGARGARSGRPRLEAFYAAPESAGLRARAATILLDQPALLAKCGPDMLQAACATVDASVSAECELLARSPVLAVVEDHFFQLETLFYSARATTTITVSQCAALLNDCWIVPALVSNAAARRLARVLVARDASAGDCDDFKRRVASLLLDREPSSERDDDDADVTFLLFVELLGHVALRTMTGKSPRGRVQALFDWLRRTRADLFPPPKLATKTPTTPRRTTTTCRAATLSPSPVTRPPSSSSSSMPLSLSAQSPSSPTAR